MSPFPGAARAQMTVWTRCSRMNEQDGPLTLVRDVRDGGLDWPKPGEVGSDSHPGGNLEYLDMREMSWTDFDDIVQPEADFIDQILSSSDPAALEAEIPDQIFEDEDDV